ncbi:MAG: SDR family NAD(P)-dependent oxidoreductase [Kiritimatiellaeota bacterium]|nr:SDR family NAD(P)-dependent oxidoreductase [Kiritimatiellota bacterium]
MEANTILKDRKALITGASGGLGAAIAKELASQGCRLFLTGRDRQRLAVTANAVKTIAPSVHEHVADLANVASLEAMAVQVLETIGPIDLLVNCAGIFPVHPLEQCTMEEYDQCLAVNVRAPFYLIRKFAPLMAKRGWGRIVNIGSSSAYAGFRDTAIYCASKHALLGLSRSLSHELKGQRVRVYCLSPGSVQTEMGRHVPGQLFETFLRPDEVAHYLAFIIAFDAELISEEVRLNRMVVQ